MIASTNRDARPTTMYPCEARHRPPLNRAMLAVCGAAAAAFLVIVPPVPAASVGGPGTTAVSSLALVPGPRIEFPISKHDFGSVGKGQTVRYDFAVRNSGGAALEILDVRPSCGCTTAAQWTKKIEPGGTGTIPIQLETAQFAGPITKTIAVTSNDPARQMAVLEIAATIWTPIQIASPVVVFPALTQLNQVVSRTVTIRNQVEGQVVISDLKSDQPLFRPELREVVPGREFELTVTTVPPFPVGTHTARITMKSSNPEMPELAVQAVATVLPAVQVAPTEIMLTSVKLAAAEKKYIVVLNHRAGDLRLSELKTNLDGVDVSTNPSPDRKQFTVTLTFPAGFEARTNGRMLFSGKTNHPELPAFEVPIVYVGNR